ncbi:ankyrin repeat domain-containing protein [Paenibacillus oleatilyticus]|uniref:ankyrin repeat domain-containing protein n=1 Tax=Paenibacillus oleatilyticus TaxID=2594886 RepID=UPI001C1FC321|nr:ankyrin repeat domain-containing protein [Paenibacillus oleatilyticus]MBU7318293.1 ankyrin repeat domain-containing protein [Paenibacillus oleatilyticus]
MKPVLWLILFVFLTACNKERLPATLKEGNPKAVSELDMKKENSMSLIADLILKSAADQNPNTVFDHLSVLSNQEKDFLLLEILKQWHRFKYKNKEEETVVKAILKSGADPNVQNDEGETVLHLIHSPNIIKIFLEDSRTKVFVAKKNGNNLLHGSVSKPTGVDKEYIKLLLEKGFDPNLKGFEGNTSLHFAVVAQEDPEVLKLLLDAKADPYLKNDKGQTAIDIATANNKEDFLKLMQKGQ